MTFESKSPFPYIDSDAVENGRFGDAHTRRNMIRGGNRLLFRGGHGFHELSMAALTNVPAETTAQARFIRGVGRPWWTRLLAMKPIRKKPGLVRARIRVRYYIQEDGTWTNNATTRARREVQLQFGTRAMPFTDIPSTDTTMSLISDGSGDWQLAELDNVPVHPSSFELFDIRFRGGLTDEAMNTGTYGTNQTNLAWGGTYYTGDHTNHIQDNSSNWSGLVHVGGHWVTFDNIPGQYVITNNPSSTRLDFAPRAPYPLESSTYAIFQLLGFRICSIACYFKDRVR